MALRTTKKCKKLLTRRYFKLRRKPKQNKTLLFDSIDCHDPNQTFDYTFTHQDEVIFAEDVGLTKYHPELKGKRLGKAWLDMLEEADMYDAHPERYKGTKDFEKLMADLKSWRNKS